MKSACFVRLAVFQKITLYSHSKYNVLFCILFDLTGFDDAWFSPVVAEVVLSSESLVADITGIWPLICVRPLVDQKIVGFGKMAATELADKLFLGL